MEKLVVSASRTRDVVCHAPGVLADILEGKIPCLLHRGAKPAAISLEQIHTLVLWTKTPFNILRNEKLRQVLKRFVHEYQGLVYLHLSVTGFGSTFVEYGIPGYEGLPEFLQQCFNEHIISPESVVIRYDPFCEIGIDGKIILSNMQTGLFEDIADKFSSIGTKSFITSRMDPIKYAFVTERMERKLGLKIYYPSYEKAVDFIRRLDDICSKKSLDFTVCCDLHCDCRYNFEIPCDKPYLHGLMNRRGCIDGRIFNRIKQERGQREYSASGVLHNDLTKGQRPECRCTWSRDIGYSAGIPKCFSRGSGCLYCYSQSVMSGELESEILAEINEIRRDSKAFFEKNSQYRKLLVNAV